AHLDPRATAELFALLSRLARSGRHTILIIEHKLDDLIDWVDSVLVLDAEGRLLFRGSPQEAFYDRASDLDAVGVWRPQTAELVAALRSSGWPVPGRPLTLSETTLALAETPGLRERLTTAARNAATGPGRDEEAGVLGSRLAVLATDRLTYRYPDGHLALQGVSMEVKRGDFLALAGANGAGKTTLASLLAGVLDPPQGQVFIDGKDAALLPTWAISDQVGYVFQNPEHQFVAESVFGELAFSLSPRAVRRGRRGGRIVLSEEEEALVNGWLDRLGLRALAEANPFTLSQGQKRRLSVAAMLIRGQAVLILDEPTLGQDKAQSLLMMEMLRDLQREGRTVVMVTHDMRLVAEYARSLLVLGEGRVLFAGSPADFFVQQGLVEKAGLAVPVVAKVSALLVEREKDGSALPGPATVEAFLQAVGRWRT
ncbi:MAG: ATP-binding cassette domain-containing protein, partial [Thermoleophilia bacterium]|nr:ATP-binding cassette domain-containing protein [Thermoleophilia bacterium]